MGNTNYPINFRPVKNIPPMEQAITASGATIAEGTPLARQADGTVAKAAASSTSLIGFAAHAVTGSTGVRQRVLFFPAVKDMIVKARVLTGTVINLTEAYGKPVGLTETASGFYIKPTATSTYCTLQTAGWDSWSTQDASLPVLQVLVAKSQWPA